MDVAQCRGGHPRPRTSTRSARGPHEARAPRRRRARRVPTVECRSASGESSRRATAPGPGRWPPRRPSSARRWRPRWPPAPSAARLCDTRQPETDRPTPGRSAPASTRACGAHPSRCPAATSACDAASPRVAFGPPRARSLHRRAQPASAGAGARAGSTPPRRSPRGPDRGCRGRNRTARPRRRRYGRSPTTSRQRLRDPPRCSPSVAWLRMR